jgi:hypothetical protein
MLKVFPVVLLLVTVASNLFLEVSAGQARRLGFGTRTNCGRATDVEIGFERTQHLLAHPRVLSTKEQHLKLDRLFP